jgi:glycosyltransferase involved in cell wall biosynthesis
MILGKSLSLVYIIGTFPGLTTTFIDREITALRQMGMHLQVLSIRRPWTPLSADQRVLQQGILYLFPIRWMDLILAHLRFSVSAPRRFFGTLFYLVTRQHLSMKTRLMTILHFGEGVYAAGILRKQPVDHIHAHFIDRAATVALVVSRLLDKPYSVTAHASDIYVKPVLMREKLGGARFVVTCTRYNRSYLEQFGSNLFNHKLYCIYHGLDTRRYMRHRPPETRPPILLSVGQLKERKGYRYLIEACKILVDKGVDFECRIIGDGEGSERDDLQALIEQRNLVGRVSLCGSMLHEDVIEQYQQASIFTLPAILGSDGDRDGIPNVILEALSMEIPVVSTIHSGVPEVVENGVNGLLVPPADAQALAEAVEKLLKDNHLRTSLGKAGRQKVIENFDPQNNARLLMSAFTGSNPN